MSDNQTPTISRDGNKFVISVDNQRVGKTDFTDRNNERFFYHTEIDDAFAGQGLASRLLEEALDATAEEGLGIVAICPFVVKHLEKGTSTPSTGWRKPNLQELTSFKEEMEQRAADSSDVTTGPQIDRVFPAVQKALNRVNVELRKVYPDVDLGQDLIELVCVRASQLNGCAACLSVHVPAARKAGVPDLVLDVLPAWRELDILSDQQRAALELTEAITLLPPGERHADAAVTAAEHFSEEQLAALEWAIIMINTYNRISIMSAHPVVEKNY